MQKITNREKIFSLISSRRVSTAQEIANYFKIPVPTVRFHIRELVRQGRVLINRGERVHPLGKPRYTYSAIKTEYDNSYKIILDLIVSETKDDKNFRHLLIQLILEHLSKSQNKTTSNLTLQLIDLIDTLNQNGYNARWEVHKNSPRVILAECPYRTSSCRISFFCEMDKLLIEKWMGRPANLKRFDQGYERSSCQFDIQ